MFIIKIENYCLFYHLKNHFVCWYCHGLVGSALQQFIEYKCQLHEPFKLWVWCVSLINYDRT